MVSALVGQINPGRADPEGIQAPAGSLEQIDARGARERVGTIVVTGGWPVVLGLVQM
jgi:hypothetical protein